MKQAVHSQKGRPVLRLEKLICLVLEVIGLYRSSFFRIAEQQYPAVRFKARYLRERRIESPQPVNLRNVSYGFAKVFVFRFFRKQTDAVPFAVRHIEQRYDFLRIRLLLGRHGRQFVQVGRVVVPPQRGNFRGVRKVVADHVVVRYAFGVVQIVVIVVQEP